jgi:integrase
MQRVKLTDRKVKSIEPGDGEWMDAEIDRLGIRGDGSVPTVTFFLYTRFPGGKGPTRRVLGFYTEPPAVAPDKELTVEELLALDLLTLAEARAKAREWLRMIGRGIDPAADLVKRVEAKTEARANTFGAVFEDFKREKLDKERKGAEVARDIRNNFLGGKEPEGRGARPRKAVDPKNWRDRPITEITDLDVLRVINVKKASAPAHARNLLGAIRRMFEWTIDQRVYGLKENPCRDIKPAKVIGKKKKRTRVLNDDELIAFWRTVKALPFPARPVYELLALTALRLNAVARASWSEFPPAVVRALRQRKQGERVDWTRVSNEPLAWIIPAARMKGEDEEAEDFLVPLTPEILAVLEGLPLFKGNFLFTTTAGKKATTIGGKIKTRIDAAMLAALKALAEERGDDPERATLSGWVNHDIRRTVRSNLSRLKVTEEAREAVMAHKRPGIKGVYDVHDYADEKREALELWAARLRSIVEPSPAMSNVVPIRGAQELSA